MEDKIVEAIEEGRIIRVSEDYARREGLLILRRPEMLKDKISSGNVKQDEEYKRSGINDFRKPLRWKSNKVVKELVENFHWEIVKRRKQMNLSRKQVAQAIGENEEDLKLLENGILSKDDFILINKVQGFMGVNLRRDGANFGASMRKLVEHSEEKKESDNSDRGLSLVGDEIEIFED